MKYVQNNGGEGSCVYFSSRHLKNGAQLGHTNFSRCYSNLLAKSGVGMLFDNLVDSIQCSVMMKVNSSLYPIFPAYEYKVEECGDGNIHM